MKLTPDEQYQARCNRVDRLRMTTEARALTRLERLEQKAAPLIGELCREGQTVYYVNTDGEPREFDMHTKAVDFLIRNKYVR